MAPIRVAIIGLSASAVTSWAARAHLPYLLSPRGRAKYEIVALLNSSVESARNAISHFQLSPETRAYGDPAELAKDADVQLVVGSTRVDTHFDTIRPSLVAGKDAFVEWPLAHNIERVRELAALAEEKGVRTSVGLQGRLLQVYLRVKETLDSGKIGKVLSSDVKAFGGLNSRDSVPIGLKYFVDLKVGGNPYTISFAHMFDSVQFILGNVQKVHANLQVQRPNVFVKDPATGSIVETIQSDVPDLIIVDGTLPSSPTVKQGATLSIKFRRGQPFKGDPAYVWTINGEKGELRLVSPSGPGIQATYSERPVIEVHDFETDTVTPVEWKDLDWQEELEIPARNIGALYEAFAEGAEAKYATFQGALKHHELLNEILEKFSPV